MCKSMRFISRPTRKPHSVLGNHLSGMTVTGHLMRSTRRFLRDGPPHCACLTLLPMGFAQPSTSLPTLVRSYRTVSPSRHDAAAPCRNLFSVALCRRVTPPGR